MLLEPLRRERDELFEKLSKEGVSEKLLETCCSSRIRVPTIEEGSVRDHFNTVCDAVMIAEEEEYKRAMGWIV